MIQNKIKKILVICFSIIFIVVSITMGIMKENTLHTNNCDISNCNLCNIINLSTDFMRNMIFTKYNMLIFFIFVFIIKLISKYIQGVKNLTLVELKVIQNK